MTETSINTKSDLLASNGYLRIEGRFGSDRLDPKILATISDLEELVQSLGNFTEWISGTIDNFTNNGFSHSPIRYRKVDSSDRANPQVSSYEINAGTVVLSAAELTEDYLYIVAFDGAIELTTSYASQPLLKDRIYLGVLIVDNNSIVDLKANLIEANPFNQTQELLFNGGIKNDEIIPTGQAGGRGILVPTGIIQVAGINFFVDSSNPHDLIINGGSIAPDVFTPSGLQIGTAETQLNFGRIWDGTNVVTFGGNDASYQRLYYCPYRPNPWVIIIDIFQHGSINNAARDKRRSTHIKPDFLGLCALFSTIVGRADYDFSGNTARVGFESHLYSDRNSGAGTTSSDGVLIGVLPSEIATVDPAIYDEFRTTDGDIYKTFDRINWVLQPKII